MCLSLLLLGGCQEQNLSYLSKTLTPEQIKSLDGSHVTLEETIRIVGNMPFPSPVLTLSGVDVFLETDNKDLAGLLITMQGEKVKVKGRLRILELVTRNQKYAKLRYSVDVESVSRVP